MATHKKSNSEIQLFFKNAASFIREHVNHVFTEKLNKQIKKLKDINENYQEEIRDAAIEFCEVNEKGIIVYDDKNNFMFNKENMKKYDSKTRTINKKIISFDLVINKESIAKLPGDYKYYFEDFISAD